MQKTLMLGLGNDILSDDAIGPNLIKHLESQFDDPDIDFKISPVGGIEIIEIIKDYDRLIIIDSIKTKSGIPGEIYHYTPQEFKETLHLSSFHDLDFHSTLMLAKDSGLTLPQSIDIIAIEIVEDLVFSNTYSPEIAVKYKDISKRVLEIVSKLIC